jgi:hypothetical protein
MRTGIAVLVIMGAAVTAMAQDLGTSRELPAKNTPILIYEPPAVPRQGGDTVEDATVIASLPYSDTGTTVGYIDDYDETCPYSGSTSPDVVYSFTPNSDTTVDVDLCGSGYDTKTYIYEGEDFNLIACNDDFYFDDDCGIYVSRIESVPFFGGNTYYIVIDGFGGDFGPYVLNVSQFEGCSVYCPDDAVLEGEPALGNGYVDAYNGGCSSPDFGNPFQRIDWINDEDGVPPFDGTAWLCGKSGWYIGPSGGYSRDTDWFLVSALETGVMVVAAQSDFPCYLAKLSPTDCDDVDFEIYVEAGCEIPATLSFPVSAGEEIWLYVSPTTIITHYLEFTYFMTVSNNTFDTVPAEGISWGGVKSLYR